MKKSLSLVLLVAILIQGCKSGADKALTDTLLNESLAHISKFAAAPGDGDEAPFQRLTERCAELAALSTASLPPVCPAELATPSQAAQDLVTTLSDERLAYIAEETTTAATIANDQARAAAVMGYWAWAAPLHRAISDLNTRVTASLDEDERVVFGANPALALIEATDRSAIVDGLIRAAEYFGAVPLVGEDEALSAATTDLEGFRAALNASARASSDRQSLIRTLRDESDNEAWQNAVSHAPTLPNLDTVRVRLAQTSAPAPVAEATEAVGALRNLQAFGTASLAVQLEVFEPGATEQFVRDCAALLVLDEAAFDKVCGAMPTVLSEVMGARAPSPSSAEPGKDSEPSAAVTVDALLEAQAPPALDALKDRLKTLAWTRPVADRLVRERVAEMDAQQRASMVAALINRIRIVQRNYAEAAFEGNFRQMVLIEARLDKTHKQLAGLSPRPLPASLDDPYALLMDRSALLRGITELSRRSRILDESIRLLGGEPAHEVARHYISEKLKRMVQVLEANPSPSDFIALLDIVDPKKRKTFLALVGRELSEDEKATALRLERQRFESLSVNLDPWRGPRGPPRDPNFPRSTSLLETFGQIFENPTHFVRQIARLRAEHTEFYDKLRREAPDQYPHWAFGADNYRGWIMAQMSLADLADLCVMIAKLKPADSMPGGSVGWTESGTELAEIDRQAKLEQRRRGPPSIASGGKSTQSVPSFSHLPRYPPDNPPELKAVEASLIDPTLTRQPTALERHALIVTALELFPSPELMPKALAHDFHKALNDQMDAGISRIDDILKNIYGKGGLNERAARAVHALDSVTLAVLESTKKRTAEAVDAMQEYVARMERAGFIKPEDPDRRTKIQTWSVRLGRPPPEKLVSKNGSGGTAAHELKPDVQIIRAEAAISDAQKKIDQVKKRLQSTTIIATPVGKEKGRAVLVQPQQAADAVNLAQMMESLDDSKTRYPRDRIEWKGLFDPAKSSSKPFDFKSSVLPLFNFDALGGGIHFGSHAEPDAEALHRITQGAHIGYNPETQMLTLILITGERFTYGPIEPRVLKALYSYVTSYPGINLAITIEVTRDDAFSLEDRQRLVLLDPSFVDTPVGQSLYLADTLPWTLDQPKLPNNKDNPISEPFKEAMNTYRQRDNSIQSLAVLLDERVRFSLADGWLQIETRMRYHYVERDDANNPPDGPIPAREIKGLGDIATKHFTAIADAFEPLARVHEYAGLTAFLRWAACTPESDEDCISRDSVTIDLSALGAFNLRDREATPTPDAEQRED